ncbi:hypothetical protein FD755_025659, partial [Muntiacus reevesi]
ITYGSARLFQRGRSSFQNHKLFPRFAQLLNTKSKQSLSWSPEESPTIVTKAPEPMRQISFVRIILDSQTASGYLSVSPNGKSMMFTDLWMNKCQRGQRFDPEPGVLGSKGFTWGKVYWKKTQGETGLEAEVCLAVEILIGITGGYHSPGYRENNEELEGEWSQENGIWPKFCLVGVARESVGFWTLQLSSAGMSICASPEPFQILSYCPQQIGVALDYDGGKVTFTNARTQEFIYEFSSAFTGRIFPFLWLNCTRSRLTLRP